MAAALVFLVVTLAGLFALEALRPYSVGSLRALAASLPAALGLGAGLLYFIFLCASFVGPVAPVWLAPFPAALLAVCCWRRRQIPLPVAGAAGGAPWGHFERVLLLGLSSVLAVTVYLAIALPLLDWDARILWALKAKILAAESTVTGEAFRDPYRLHIHPRYPLLVPWLASLPAQVSGKFQEWHYQLLLCCFGVLTLGEFYLLCRRLVARSGSLLLTLLMAVTGNWLAAMFDARIEIVLVFYLLLALGAYCRWHEDRRRTDLGCFGFFLYCLAMTKNEGLLLAVALLGAGVFVAASAGEGWRRGIQGSLVAAAVWVLFSLPWLWHLSQIPPVADENYLARLDVSHLQEGLARSGSILRSVAAAAFDLHRWHLLWLAPLLLPVVMRPKRRSAPPLLFAAVVIVCYLAGVGIIYLISPWRDIGMQVAVTFDRVMLPLLPLLVLLMLGSGTDAAAGVPCKRDGGEA